MSSTLVAIFSMGFLGAVFAGGLVLASQKFAVDVDPTVDALERVLPGINCGACGFAGCRSFAEGLAEKKAPPNGCPIGGNDVTTKIGGILGMDTGSANNRKVAQVLCKGGHTEASIRAEYNGPMDCRVANLTQGGDKGCTSGCLGLGTCVESCFFEAMAMNDNGLPLIDEDMCTACGKCVAVCPRDIIVLAGEEYGVHIRCRSEALGKEVRKVCTVGCIACRKCEKECPVDAITVVNNVAAIDYDKCIVCRKCVSVCPVNTIEAQDGKPIVKQKKVG